MSQVQSISDQPAPWLRPAERLMLGMIIVLGLATVALTEMLGRNVAWSEFALGITAVFLLIAVGAYARHARSAYRLASCAIGIGLYAGFSAFASIFVFALYPLPHPIIDPQLAAIDKLVGYDWKGFTEGLAALPVLPEMLRFLYLSSFPQLALMILFLGITRREVAQCKFLLLGMLALIACATFWYFWPSVGPSAFNTVSEDVQKRFSLATDPVLGRYLLDLLASGPPEISPKYFTGIIAFPSFHIIMAVMVAWYARGTRLIIPAILAAIGMVPATLAHGGHHLVDLFGGLAVFLLCNWITVRIIPDTGSEPTT